jgi:hypothetical protein
VRFGTSEFHPEPQWILRAVDVAKIVMREFALTSIHAFAKERP